MRKTVFILTICLVSAGVSHSGTYSGGTGDPNDPFLIGVPEDIMEMSYSSEDWDNHFLMIADVNMADYSFETAIISPDANDVLKNHQGPHFSGTFNGDGYEIAGVVIDTLPNSATSEMSMKRTCASPL